MNAEKEVYPTINILFRNLNLRWQISIQFYLAFVIRRILIGLVLVYGEGTVQAYVCICIHALYLLYIVITRPYRYALLNVVLVLCELIVLITSIIIPTYDQRIDDD